MTDHSYISLRCSIHLHTYASDGQASLYDIYDAARKLGIDCVVITDHETLGLGFNGYIDQVLVITGEEITPDYTLSPDPLGRMKGKSTNNHLLALGINEPILAQERTPQQLIDIINRNGGLSFLAHPEEPGHAWTDWDVDNFTGIEIWTYKATWKRNLQQINSKIYGWRNPDVIIDAPSEVELDRWDKLGQRRRIVGLGCSDNHAYSSEIDGIECVIFPWEIGLSGIVSYVWVDEKRFSNEPVATFLDAIAHGRVIIAHDGLHQAKGFQVFAKETYDSQLYLPGACIRNMKSLVTQVTSPITSTIRILRNGSLIYEANDADKCEFELKDPGVWRVEAWLKNRAWVFANPFYVGLWKE